MCDILGNMEIVTPRLHLRVVTPQDSGRIIETVADPRIHCMLAHVPPGRSKAQMRAWITMHDQGCIDDMGHIFSIMKDGALIGVTGAHRWATDLPFEVCYWLAPEAWGQGYVTEASSALIRWLECRKGVRALVSGHFADNPASGRVLAKLGFLPSGRLKTHNADQGEWVDYILMARIA